ncbi:MAG: formyltransferase [Candidatus Dojkabacteria bacterium]
MNSRPKVLVFAYSEVGSVCLEALLKDGANVVAVYTHEDDPNEEIWFRSVKKIAEKNKIPVRTPNKLESSDIEEIKTFEPELILSFYYRAMIPKSVLDIPRLGAYNVHGALLPKYRGRACVNWAVINGETETGSTLHVMTEFADRGNIISQKTVPILFEDTGHDVFMKIVDASRDIVMASLHSLETGTAKHTLQNEFEATKYGRRRPEDGKIDWNKSAVEIYNLIRSVTHPFPGAFTEWEDKKVFIWKALPEEGEGKPGEIVSRKPMLVGTGKGLLRIIKLQPEGELERDA